MPVFRAFLEGFVAFGDSKRAFFDVRECRWRLQALKITLRDRPADAFLIGFLPTPSRVWGLVRSQGIVQNEKKARGGEPQAF